ncbi:MAG: 30S ribosomal protein S20 [Rhodospirillaceae bacterium]|jgi:small subunit ribosomal protein S20|nr:30S ribosomal protein S20 [Rhodospirillaceae bacterium]MBT4219249.1 30S ribosomal protein S20 [Rhodospirillaceae bacterium]MBT4463061.1 30S ribosomal protein S20 [Rhodospirillaceae bacterium]MBT5014690.1 30S ribosomal protein S20 [Rhodospirillaceae bacterium]MBT5308827.1 30S ribosomal protein S20 [Rhodospirillaceae bacterium]
MANITSAKKRIRQTARRTTVNNVRRTRIRSYIRLVEEAIDGGDKGKAQDAFKAAQPEMMRGVLKGIYHKNTVSRKLSRLSARIKAMAA